MKTDISDFEATTTELTQEMNGQYPRPWMTKLDDPLAAELFIVGRNQRNGYDADRLGPHSRHIDALFNRNGETCRSIYDQLTAGKTSPTRKNTDSFVRLLEAEGIDRILETNALKGSDPLLH